MYAHRDSLTVPGVNHMMQVTRTERQMRDKCCASAITSEKTDHKAAQVNVVLSSPATKHIYSEGGLGANVGVKGLCRDLLVIGERKSQRLQMENLSLTKMVAAQMSFDVSSQEEAESVLQLLQSDVFCVAGRGSQFSHRQETCNDWMFLWCW